MIGGPNTKTDVLVLAEHSQAIKNCVMDSVWNFSAIGYHLKQIREKELYKAAGWNGFGDYVRAEFGFSNSVTTRYMQINDKFSVDGNSFELDQKYTEFNKSQLQEMLYLTDEQMEQVQPDMTVKEIRRLREPGEPASEKVESILTSMMRLPEDDVPGQVSIEELEGGRYMPEVCAEENYPVKDAMQEIAASQILSAHGLPQREYPEGSLLSTPGCKGDGRGYDCFLCPHECGIRQENRRCRISATEPCTVMGMMEDIRNSGTASQCQFVNMDLVFRRLGDGEASPCCLKCEKTCIFRCPESMQRISSRNREAEKSADTQPFPKLRTREERERWVNDYKAWGLWYHDANIDVNYYKFDFGDGSRLIVSEYPQREDEWTEEPRDRHCLHLLKERRKYRSEKTFAEKYSQNGNSMTEVVDFLTKYAKSAGKEKESC